MEESNLRIDQLTLGIPRSGDYGIFRDMLNSKTKRYLLPTGTTSQNFEWLTDTNYLTGSVVTYGGEWWQSASDVNENITPGTNAAKWTSLSKSDTGSWWSAGVYSEDDPWVLSNHNGKAEIFVLVSAARPYNSTDIATEEAAGDWISITQWLREVDVDVAVGGVSILDFKFGVRRIFEIDDLVAAAHEIQFGNSGNANEFYLRLQITATPAPITFPAGTESDEVFFDDTTKIWSPIDIGYYHIKGIKIGAAWILEFKRLNK